MYLNVEPSEEQKLRLQQKYQEYVDEVLTDELLGEIFKETLKGHVKAVLSEIVQDKDFKTKVKNKAFDVVVKELNI